MSLIQSIILGIIQGITEFLPISSSGHLAIFNIIFGLESGEDIVAFDLLLHFGTLIAVFIVYHKEIWALIKAFFTLIKKVFCGKLKEINTDERFLIYVIVATLPLVAVKLLGLDEYVEKISACLWAVGAILIFNGAVLFFSDRFARGNIKAEEGKWYNALAVGICQMFAVLPGLSRSGSTITGGMLNGYDRESAVRFSFILSIPAILGACIFEVPDLLESTTSASQLGVYLAGTAVAAIVGVGAMNLLKYISKKGSFRFFSYYCFAVGAFALIYGLVK